MSDVFDGVEHEEAGSKDPYVVPGRYVIAVEDIKYREKTRKGYPMYIARWRIIRSNNPLRPVGTVMSWMVGLANDDAIKLKTKDIALHAAAAYRVDHTKVTGNHVRDTWHPDQPLRGRTIDVEATDIDIKGGRKFTKCNFSAPRANNEELIQELERIMTDPSYAMIPAQPAAAAPPPAPPAAPPTAPPTSRGPVIPI